MSTLRLFQVSESRLTGLGESDRATLVDRLEAGEFTVVFLDFRKIFEVGEGEPDGAPESKPVKRASEIAEEVLRDDLDLHPLIAEDIESRNLLPPKVDRVGANRFIVLNYFDREPGERIWEPREINFATGENYVLVTYFDELPFAFDRKFPVAEAERKHTLTWSVLHFLLDVTVDSIARPIADLEERVDSLEEEFADPENLMDYNPENFERIARLRKQVLAVRRACESNREVLNNLLREVQSDPDAPNLYFSDIYDHLVRYLQLVSAERENITTLIELNMNQLANRTNEIMRVLTVIGAVFLPLTFVAGVYGMNFENMPELGVSWAYPAVWVLMLVVASGMFYWFHRRGWL